MRQASFITILTTTLSCYYLINIKKFLCETCRCYIFAQLHLLCSQQRSDRDCDSFSAYPSDCFSYGWAYVRRHEFLALTHFYFTCSDSFMSYFLESLKGCLFLMMLLYKNKYKKICGRGYCHIATFYSPHVLDSFS